MSGFEQWQKNQEQELEKEHRIRWQYFRVGFAGGVVLMAVVWLIYYLITK